MSDDEFNPVLGIDLGTTNSSIARWDSRRGEPDVYSLVNSRRIPSVVYYPDKGDVLVGKLAKNKLIMDPENGVEKIKRHIGEEGYTLKIRGRTLTPVDVSAEILSKLMKDVRGKFPTGKWDPAGAVITHPYYFKYPQVANTEAAAKKAGINVFRLIPEPVAAAFDYGLHTQRFKEESSAPETILIFDPGGGTFDVTVFRMSNEKHRLLFEVLSTGGDDRLGGTDFDEALVDYCLGEARVDLGTVDRSTQLKSLAKLNEAAINTKCELSEVETSLFIVPDVLPGQHLDLTVTREQFVKGVLEQPPAPGRHWSSPPRRENFLERIRRIVEETISKSGLRRGEINRPVLVGGSSRIPIMRDILKDLTGTEPWESADRDLAVTRGAAIVAAKEDARIECISGDKEIVIEVPTSHALGVRTAGGVFTRLIPENRKTPCDATQVFEKKGQQGFLNIEVFQGSGKKVTDAGVAKVGVVPITGLPQGTIEIKVTFKVNVQQMVSVRAEWKGGFVEENLRLKQ